MWAVGTVLGCSECAADWMELTKTAHLFPILNLCCMGLWRDLELTVLLDFFQMTYHPTDFSYPKMLLITATLSYVPSWHQCLRCSPCRCNEIAGISKGASSQGKSNCTGFCKCMCNWSQNWKLAADICVCLTSRLDGWETLLIWGRKPYNKLVTGRFSLSMKFIYASHPFFFFRMLERFWILSLNWFLNSSLGTETKGNINFSGRVLR